LTHADIEALVERALFKHRVLTPKAIAPILIELRQRRLRERYASSICPRCRCGVLAVPNDPKPNALALMQRATLSQLRDDATDLAGLVREIQKPLPTLPLDATERSWF